MLLNIHSQVEAQISFTKSLQSFTDAGISGGVAWADVNNDNYPELIFTNFGFQKNHFYTNYEGTLTIGGSDPVTGNYSGIAVADINNDGFLEAFITTQQNQHNVLFKHSGNSWHQFEESNELQNDYGDSYSATLLDVENDGFLDLLVSNGAFQPVFFYTNKKGTYSRALEVIFDSSRPTTFGVSTADINQDGIQDLFLANKGANNSIYLSDGNGGLKSVKDNLLVTDGGNSNGGSWGDFDNDGDLDLYVANGPFLGEGEADFLYENQGDLNFKKLINSSITKPKYRSMSGSWGDFDNDGDLDLIVTRYKDSPVLFENLGNGEFSESIIPSLKYEITYGTGNAIADYDFDGDLDFAIANWENLNNVLIENVSKKKEWIRFKLVGVQSNKSAIGSKVIVTTKEVTQFRELVTSHGFRSQNDFSAQLHFGLNNSKNVEYAIIKWPSGHQTELHNLESGYLYEVQENEGITKRYGPALKFSYSTEQLVSVYLESNVNELLNGYLNNDQHAPVEKYISTSVAIGGFGRVSDAKIILEKATEYFPKSSEAVFWTAFINRLTGDIASAEAGFKQSLSLIGDDPYLSSNLKRQEIINTANYELSKINN